MTRQHQLLAVDLLLLWEDDCHRRAWERYEQQRAEIEAAGGVEQYLRQQPDGGSSGKQGTLGITGHPGQSGGPTGREIKQLSW
jgi:hypothetical protein